MQSAVENCRVICDYESKDLTELSLKVGDVVEVLKKGKYLWFGRLHDAKGFFPSQVVEAEGQSSNHDIGNLLSATAIADNEKKGVIDGSVKSEILVESNNSDKPFTEIGTTKILKDKRRSKPKSPGRPPSQVFLKEYILQKSESMEDLNNISNDEENSEQEVTPTGSFTKITTVSQLVMELKQKPNFKLGTQKDDITSASSESNTVERTEDNIPKKPLLKKKLSVPEPPKKPDNSKTVPPWMEEIRKKREHRLSLKGEDETLQKATQEFRTINENKINHTSVETKSIGKIWTTNNIISEETRSIQTNAVSLERRQVTSNTSKTATEISLNRNYSSVGITPALDSVTNNNDLSIETNTISQTSTISNAVNSQSSSSPTSINSCSIEQSKRIKNSKDTLGKIEPHEIHVTASVTATSDKAVPSGSKQISEAKPETEGSELSIVGSSENQATLYAVHQKDISKEEQASSVPQHNEETVNSIQSLLNLVDSFEAQRAVRSSEILDNIKKMEASFNRQNQETMIFIEAMKARLSVLIKDKH